MADELRLKGLPPRYSRCQYDLLIFRFRRELAKLHPKLGKGSRSIAHPNRIIVVHLLLSLGGLVAHYPLLVILGFLFFPRLC